MSTIYFKTNNLPAHPTILIFNLTLSYAIGCNEYFLMQHCVSKVTSGAHFDDTLVLREHFISICCLCRRRNYSNVPEGGHQTAFSEGDFREPSKPPAGRKAGPFNNRRTKATRPLQLCFQLCIRRRWVTLFVVCFQLWQAQWGEYATTQRVLRPGALRDAGGKLLNLYYTQEIDRKSEKIFLDCLLNC
jgi:hypothetical protein